MIKKFAIGVGILAFLQMIFIAAFIWMPRDPAKSTGATSVTARIDEVIELPMPDAVLYRHDRTEVDVASLRGEPVVLHLWGTWCPPCVEELPALLDRAATAEQPLLAVAIDDDWESLEKFFPDGVPTDVLLPSDATFVKDLGVSGLPATLLIDADGTVRKRWSGARAWTAADWRRLVAQ